MDTDHAAFPNVESSNTGEALSQAPKQPGLSVIVPTRNEAGNIEPLLSRLGRALKGTEFEVIFVDDSTDNTPDVIREKSKDVPFDVQVIARPPERRNGLGKAVVEGMQQAKAPWMVVMDGDLQHPPEVIREMVEKASSTGADLVVASRLTEGASTGGLSKKRAMLSRLLTLGLRLSFPKNLRNVSDPLTGFFLVRRAAFKPDELRPEGFKILLELMMRNPKMKVSEVPFEFGKRHSGTSKASPEEMLRLVRQTIKLRMITMQSLMAFLLVGLSGIFVNMALMFVFTGLMGVNYLLSAVFATQGSTLWNFSWTDRWVFGSRSQQTLNVWQRAASFFAINNAMLLLRGPILVLLVAQLGVNYLVANLISLVALTLVRYAISDNLIWGLARESKPYYYDIQGIIRIRSAQRLPELGYFRTEAISEPLDFDITIHNNPMKFATAETITYDELLGRLGFSLVIDRSQTPTKVYASPLVGRSPHVLYTNVVEPLLRWEFVRKGYALMHGACIAFDDDQALFITAKTDTGKTTTILQIIREQGGKIKFLSDDMTILSPDGQVMSFPKPLTISKHTLMAARCSDELTFRERMFLQVQSRLHSRGGRMFGMWLTQGNIPGATLNAIVQAIVPPPKYMVDRLIPGAQIIKRSRLSGIAVIERGPELERELGEPEKLRTLLANAEDAYGFPPYPVLAEQLSTYKGENRHPAERAIVETAINGLPAVHIRRSNYDWYQQLPNLMSRIAQQKNAPIAVPAPVIKEEPVPVAAVGVSTIVTQIVPSSSKS